jgi:hypothetical protein
LEEVVPDLLTIARHYRGQDAKVVAAATTPDASSAVVTAAFQDPAQFAGIAVTFSITKSSLEVFRLKDNADERQRIAVERLNPLTAMEKPGPVLLMRLSDKGHPSGTGAHLISHALDILKAASDNS